MGRIWQIAVIADTFHVLPSVVARDLDRDPELLGIVCTTFLQYAEAKNAEERSKDPEDLRIWKGSRIMDAVLQNKYDLHQERIAKMREEK